VSYWSTRYSTEMELCCSSTIVVFCVTEEGKEGVFPACSTDSFLLNRTYLLTSVKWPQLTIFCKNCWKWPSTFKLTLQHINKYQGMYDLKFSQRWLWRIPSSGI
jgi:hypothetical protein